MEEQIGLEQAIRAMRTELMQAMEAGAGEDVRFKVNSVGLEFQVVVSKEAEATGRVRFWVVDVGGGGKLASASTHTVRIELDPLTSTGDDVEVSDVEAEKPD